MLNRLLGLKRYLPLLLIVLTMVAFFYCKFYRYFTFSTLSQYQYQLIIWAQQHYLLTVLSYMAIYIIVVAISVPGAALLTITAGFLFGVFPGVIYVVVSATTGACLLFLSVRNAIGNYFAQKASGWLKRMEAGFRKNAWNYLLFLRLVPLFPFWVVNIVPGLLAIPLRIFFSATLLGIIPGSLVYVWLGRDLGALLAVGKAPDMLTILQPIFFLPILALAALSLAPIIYRRWKHD